MHLCDTPLPPVRIRLHFDGSPFSREIVRLFLSYLTNRTQRIKISSTFSDWTNIVKGIPQGSTLGPLLFNIFMILILMIYSFSQQNMKSVILLMSIAFILVA